LIENKLVEHKQKHRNATVVILQSEM